MGVGAQMRAWIIKPIFKIIRGYLPSSLSYTSVQCFFSSDYMINDSIKDFMEKHMRIHLYYIKPVITALESVKQSHSSY